MIYVAERAVGNARKFNTNFIGPYKISEKRNDNSYVVCDFHDPTRNNVFHVSKLAEYHAKAGVEYAKLTVHEWKDVFTKGAVKANQRRTQLEIEAATIDRISHHRQKDRRRKRHKRDKKKNKPKHKRKHRHEAQSSSTDIAENADAAIIAVTGAKDAAQPTAKKSECSRGTGASFI